MASLATAASERASIEAFQRDVMQASLTKPVLAYFTATWCGPCKTFGPIIDRVVEGYKGRVGLAKVDIDKSQTLSQQLRVQSVPTVYAFIGGQPVDAFAGAVGERELKAFIDRLLTMAPGEADGASDIEALIEAGNAALAEGANADAAEIFSALAAEAPERADIAAGLARALLGAGDPDGAARALDGLPAEAAKDPAVTGARAAIDLARSAGGAARDLAAARAAAAAAPDDPEKAMALADALIGAGDRDGAAETLLGLIARDPQWNEGAARARLLKLFEAVGLADPWTLAQRRKLSALIFR